jgi:phage-related protein
MAGIVIGEADVKVGADTSETGAEIKAGLAKSLAEAETASADSGGRSGQSFGSRFASWLMPGKKSLITSGILAALATLPGIAGIAGVGIGAALVGGMVAVIAKGAVSSVMPLVQAYGKLQQAAPGKAQVAALAAYNQQLAQMSPAQRALASSIEKVQSAWQSFVKANVAGVSVMLSGGLGLIPGLLTQMGGVFRSVVPQMASVWKNLGGVLNGLIGIAKTAAPAFGPFVNALLSLVGNILPGLQVIIRATIPLIGMVGQIFSQVGTDIGQLFAVMAPAVASSMPIFKALMGLIGGLLPVIGQLAAALAGSLGPVLAAFAGAVKALSPALIVIGKILGSLAGAILSSLAGALTSIAQLLQAVAPSFGLLASVLSLVFTAMENSGVFGVLEGSLEKLAVPLGNLIDALLKSLLPVLPLLINLFIEFAAVLTQALADGLVFLINALTWLVTKLPFLLPLILGIVGAMRLWAAIQAIVNVLMDANPIGLIIIAIAALIIIIVEVVKHWSLISKVAAEVWNDILSFIKKWWPILLGFLLGPFGLLLGLFVKFHGQILSAVTRAWNAVFSFIKGIGMSIVSVVHGAWSAAVNAISDAISRMLALAESLPGRILSALGNLGSLLVHEGESVVEGLWNGISSMSSWLIGQVESWIASVIPGPIRKILGIGSPSKVMDTEVGAWIGPGIAQGIIRSGGVAMAAASSLGSRLAGAIKAAAGGLSAYGSTGSVHVASAANFSDYSSAVQQGAYQGVLTAMQQGNGRSGASIVINASTATAASAAGIAQSLRSLSELGIV